MSEITETLRIKRLAARIPQIELAARLGVSNAFLCQIETGRRELPARLYRELPDEIRPAVVGAAIRELEHKALLLRPLLVVKP